LNSGTTWLAARHRQPRRARSQDLCGRSTGYQASFTYPAAWQLADPSQSNSLANGAGISLTDSAGNEMARLALGDTNEWTSCLNEAPYKVIDTQPMPGLPFNPAVPSQGAPRFALPSSP
jgi:hypothetical protein